MWHPTRQKGNFSVERNLDTGCSLEKKPDAGGTLAKTTAPAVCQLRIEKRERI